MRTREFTMKDSYSFDRGPAELDVSFNADRDAYARAFERLGIPAIQAEASNGTMGGSDRSSSSAPRRPARTLSSTARTAITRPT